MEFKSELNELQGDFSVKVNSKQTAQVTALERRAFILGCYSENVKHVLNFNSQLPVIMPVKKARKIWESLKKMAVLKEIRSMAL